MGTGASSGSVSVVRKRPRLGSSPGGTGRGGPAPPPGGGRGGGAPPPPTRRAPGGRVPGAEPHRRTGTGGQRGRAPVDGRGRLGVRDGYDHGGTGCQRSGRSVNEPPFRR